MGGEEGFEEWDADFLDQLIQVEELALSAAAAPCHASSSQHPLPRTHSPPHLEFTRSRYDYNSTVTHSPPRYLSQRLISDVHHVDARDLQVDQLKVRGFISVPRIGEMEKQI